MQSLRLSFKKQFVGKKLEYFKQTGVTFGAGTYKVTTRTITWLPTLTRTGPLKTTVMDILIDTQLTLDQQSIDSRLSVNRLIWTDRKLVGQASLVTSLKTTNQQKRWTVGRASTVCVTAGGFIFDSRYVLVFALQRRTRASLSSTLIRLFRRLNNG